jgi:hypothetical protein
VLHGRLAAAGKACAGQRQLEDPVADAVLAEVGEVGAEGVGEDRVGADLEVGVVDLADHVGAADGEDLVAALVLLEVVEAEVEALQHRAHRTVGHDHPLAQGGAQRSGDRHGCSPLA